MMTEIVGRVKTFSKKISGRGYDGLDLLRADHMKVEAMLIELRLMRTANHRKKLFDIIAEALEKHMRIEEEIFYPACAKVPKLEKLIDQSQADHQLVKDVIVDMPEINPETPAYNKLLDKFILKIEKHVFTEESKVFPMARKFIDKNEFRRLNQAIIDAFGIKQGTRSRYAQ